MSYFILGLSFQDDLKNPSFFSYTNFESTITAANSLLFYIFKMKRKADDSWGTKTLSNLDIELPKKQSALDRINNNLPFKEFWYCLFSQTAVDNLTKTYAESKP